MIKTRQTLMLAVLMTIVFGLMTMVLANGAGPMQAHAVEAVGAMSFAGMRHNAGWGGWRHGRGGHICKEGHIEARIDRMVDYVEGFVTFTPEQDDAWNGLVSAVREGSDDFAALCDAFEDAEDQSAPERLALGEQAIVAALGAMQKARPAFDRFYGTLNEEQKQLLDRAFAGRHHHRGWGWGDEEH